MTAITFVVPGKPTSWKRRSLDPRTGRWVTPNGMRKVKAGVAACARAAMLLARTKPLEGPVSLTVDCYARRVPDAVPDWDNLGKLISDAINGICWGDDAQVVRAVVQKHDTRVTGGEPRTEVRIEPMTATGEAQP